MLQNSFGVQVSYASVDRSDGSDPRPSARDVLSALRALAGVRDATAAWGDRTEAVLVIPLTDGGTLLTLTDEDAIATTLTVDALREAFVDAGLNLWIDAGTPSPSGVEGFEEFEAEFDESDGIGDDEDAEEFGDLLPELFEPTPVRVAAFSHRGPAVARILAEANRTAVEHAESGVWSLQRFRSSEPTSGWVSAKAELPVIEVNRTDDGDGWIEVTAASGTVPFWPDAERDTQPVLDLDTISVAETAEVYRRLLAEGDGSRDELVEIAASTHLDVERAHRALIAEALGGIVGSDERRGAFLAAFGIPADLIARAFDDSEQTDRRFEPVGWAPAVWNTLIAGVGELAPLTRRDTFWQRLTGAIRRRPVLGLAIAAGELIAGLWAASRLRGLGRGVGVLAVIDAIGGIAVWVARLRRR